MKFSVRMGFRKPVAPPPRKRGLAGYGFDYRDGKRAWISLETLKQQGAERSSWPDTIIAGGLTHSRWEHKGEGWYECTQGYAG